MEIAAKVVDGAETPKQQVLLVEDDPEIARVVCEGLGGEGFEVIWKSTLQAGRDHVAQLSMDIVVLDLMLPDGSGLDLLHWLRTSNSQVPVCLLTAKDALDDKVLGFEAGADDYLTKPFALAELAARLRALLKRSQLDPPGSGTSSEVVLGDLVLDTEARYVTVRGRGVQLTRREFDLMATLLSKPGAVFSREQLIIAAWPATKDVNLNTVDVYVSYLRRKLEQADSQAQLETVRGLGFKVIAP